MDNNITSLISAASGYRPKPPGVKPDKLEKPAPPPGDKVDISPGAGEPAKKVKASVLPQDPFVGGPETVAVPKEMVGEKLLGPRVETQDPKNPKAIADVDGNYFYQVGTPEFAQVNAHTVVGRTLDMFKLYTGQDIPWAFSDDRIKVLPHAKEGKNAYYSRWEESVNFFFFNSPSLKKMVKTSEAADVVSHEAGHAILDGLRPGLLGSWSTEPGAIHEAFGDMSAMLFNLQSEENIKGVIQETGGDFKKQNRLAGLAEEFGAAVHRENTNPNDDDRTYLRTAINNWKYANPSSLPSSGGEDVLTSEIHNFSRIMSGAFYDALTAVFDQVKASNGGDSAAALATTRDIMGNVLGRTVLLSPSSNTTYSDFAKAMLKAEKQLYDGKYAAAFKNSFANRNIKTPEAVDIAGNHVPDIRLDGKLDTPQDALDFVGKHGKELGVPKGISFEVDSLTAGRDGSRHVSLSFNREVKLRGPEYGKYQGYYTDVKGGLTLFFDGTGKLTDANFENVDKAVIARNLAGLKTLIDLNQIADDPSSIFQSDNPSIFKGIAETDPSGRKKLTKIPVIS
jgi:hypothetical protein